MAVVEREILGEWLIVESEEWDREALDLLGPASIIFGPERTGELRMIAVVADLDYRVSSRGGQMLVEFSLEGTQEGDKISGRGWAIASGRGLRGHLYFHGSDDSEFLAERPAGSEPVRSDLLGYRGCLRVLFS